MSRLSVLKTHKLYIGGKFVRSESGRSLRFETPSGPVHASRASRKDLRDSVGFARKAQPGWWGRTAYNRGQILYRLAEMLEDRRTTLPTSEDDASQAIDRAVHHAGWTDKISALLSTLNPVSAAYVNYSKLEPLGVVLAVPHPEDGLTGLVESLCNPLLMGSSVVLVVPADRAEIALALAECLAVSDVPAGVINLLTGDFDELLTAANHHDDIDGFWLTEGALTDAQLTTAETEAARMIRRIHLAPRAARPAAPIELLKLAEVKTVWMSC